MSIFVVDQPPPAWRGAHEHKMGQRASPVGALHFDAVAAAAGTRCWGEENTAASR